MLLLLHLRVLSDSVSDLFKVITDLADLLFDVPGLNFDVLTVLLSLELFEQLLVAHDLFDELCAMLESGADISLGLKPDLSILFVKLLAHLLAVKEQLGKLVPLGPPIFVLEDRFNDILELFVEKLNSLLSDNLEATILENLGDHGQSRTKVLFGDFLDSISTSSCHLSILPEPFVMSSDGFNFLICVVATKACIREESLINVTLYHSILIPIK